MNSNEKALRLFNGTDKKKINRRTFFKQGVGCTAGLTLLSFPGIINEVLAEKGDKSKEEIFKELEAKVERFMPMYQALKKQNYDVETIISRNGGHLIHDKQFFEASNFINRCLGLSLTDSAL